MKIGNLEVYGIIYKITNLVNGKVYIGQTTNERGFEGRYDGYGIGIERVYNYYKYRTKQGDYCNTHLFSSIKKYGFKNFIVNEMFDFAFSESELNIKEKTYINLYKSDNNIFGYNKTNGGNNFKANLDTIRKLSKTIICLNDGNIFESTREASEYYNITIQQINNSCNGKHLYAETKDKKIRLIFKSIEDYNLLSEKEIKELLNKVENDKKKGLNHNSRKVYCITFDKTFNSLTEAENHYNIGRGVISSYLRGKCNKVIINGINTVWCYLEEFKNMSKEDVDLLVYKSTDEYRSEILSKAHIGKYTPSENPNSKKVICLTTGEVFNSGKEAIEKYNCNGLYLCLKGKIKTSGKHPTTGEKLRWDYYKKINLK